MVSQSAASSATTLHETPSLLSVLKALPPDCVRNNFVSAFGRLTDADGCRARPPIGNHQWLPGQWTPVLYGLSQDWRAFARCVLTHSLTVDLAITVSLQRPCQGGNSAFDALDAFLAGFPSLQHLTILAGNGGAPVDDSGRPPAHITGNSSTLLAMAEAVSVALAAQQMLRLDRPDPPLGVSTSTGPRLTCLDLRLHPGVWRALRGTHPDDFLQRLVTAHPSLEELALNVAAPVPAAPGAGAAAVTADRPTSPSGGQGEADGFGVAAVVGVGPLEMLPGFARLRLTGPMVVEGLAALTQLQALTLEGIVPTAALDASLPTLTGLTSLRLSDTHHRPSPLPAGSTAGRPPGPCALSLARLCGHPAAPIAGRLRSLQLPDVVVGPKEWPLLAQLSPGLQELELASARPAVPQAAAKQAAPTGQGSSSSRRDGSGLNSAALASGVPDWFLRATVGDEAAYSMASGGSGSSSVGQGGDGEVGGRNKAGAAGAGAAGGGGGCPFRGSVAAAAGGSGRSFTGSGAAGGVRPGPTAGAAAGAGGAGPASSVLTGLKRLVLWEYIPPSQIVELVQLLPDLRELRAALLLDDPPNLPAAALRPAAVAILRPLVEALRPLHDVRLAVSCDPAAVTGQLACIFLMECGLAAVDGIQGLSLTVWVAAETQLGSLAALAQLRSLELTLGKQEQESELSVLTRLERLSYLSLRITPGIWNEIQGRTGRVTAGAALRLAMSFAAGQALLLVADVHREICEDEAISLVKSVEMTTGQPGSAWAVSAWVEETAECIMGFGPSAGGSATLGGGGGGGGGADGGVLRVVWTPELVRRLLGVVAGLEGSAAGGLSVSFMGTEEERLGRVLGS